MMKTFAPDPVNANQEGQSPIRVAIVGGGCAALTAAFELTRPENLGRYQVTVYQMGWRLGGKGASGRTFANRIEEHGLHLWMGFYENAFRLMRECYAERAKEFPNCRFANWWDAFHPAPDVGVADRNGGGWSFWLAHFPPGQGEPGDPTTGGPFTVRAYLRQSVVLMIELLRSAGIGAPPDPGQTGSESDRGFGQRGTDALAAAFRALMRYGPLATSAAIVEASEILREAIDLFLPMFRESAVLPMQILEALTATARAHIEDMAAANAEVQRVWQVIDLILAILRGSMRCGLALDPRGFDAINEYDWRDWLRMHGASDRSLDSGFMRGIYDLAFAFEDGDVTRPRLAAGVALRGAMRMFFTYRGALFWSMNAGMGDVVFAPLYQVLKRRGVRFEFFHRLRNVALGPAGSGEPAWVHSLEFDIQARVAGGGEYQPLIHVNNLPSWPGRPHYDQLVDGLDLDQKDRDFEAVWEHHHEGARTLEVKRDFDFVVLGVSIGALPSVASELIEREPAWRDMVRHVKTVPTQAFQVWMRKSAGELGWNHRPVNLAGFVEPFDTWADMSHLIPEESWNDEVKSIAYFCSVLPDPAPNGTVVDEILQRDQQEVVRRNAVRFLNRDVRALWPQAVREDGRFDWDALAAPEMSPGANCVGEDRFQTQFWRANVNPTDRYVQSLPGSISHRISPLDMTFDNLTIAGDWTATGLDTGCIESAVMSGLLASHAISGKPALEDIVGYDHP